MRIAIAGGTGLTGSAVTEEVRRRGHGAVVLARSTGVDLTVPDGLGERLADVDAVIDVSNTRSMRRPAIEQFFRAVTDNLVTAEAAAGVRHHIVLSIVGSDKVDTAHYFGKRMQESRARAGLVPVTILRATQFFEFAGQMLDSASFLGGRVAIAPRMLCQPVAVAEVAAALVDAAVEPVELAGLLPDMAGPEVLRMPGMVRRLAKVRGRRAWIIPIRMPGKGGGLAASGGLLPVGGGRRGTMTFDSWLRTQAPTSHR